MKLFITVIISLLTIPVMTLADNNLPVENGVVTSGVGWRIDPFGSGKLCFHRGIDIAVPVGTPVRATRPGRIVFAGERSGYGATVIVEHSNGDRTLYGHNSMVRVMPGDQVKTGAVLAFSGNSGRSTGPHVHFEQIASGRPVADPAEIKNAESIMPQLAADNNQRYVLEQRMEESVNSILRSLNRSALSGQGG